jgi:hypothetical protein
VTARAIGASARRCWSRLLPLALAPALAAAYWPAGAHAQLHDPACGEMRLPTRQDQVVYLLSHGFLKAGGERVTGRDGAWRRGSDYVLDALRGELRLLRAPLPGDTLSVEACWLLAPPPLERAWLRYRPASSASPDTARLDAGAPAFSRAAVARNPNETPTGTTLALTGNKTIAVDFGSQQDAFLRQSLDLTVSGSLAPGVEVAGVLSDRNTPLTPQGSTTDLQSLDRVRLEVRSPQAQASLGDVSLSLAQGEFARIERRLQGVEAAMDRGGAHVRVAAASLPGEWRRASQSGIEGVQGPYVLAPDGGGVTVVAGSEVVTLDGERLTRGEGADYAIDYETGRVTFTHRRPIRSSSRITVDYQASLDRFKRNLVAASAGVERSHTRAWVQTVSETDDRGRPVDTPLSEEDRLRLSLAGDSTSRALSGGVVTGGGDYDTVRVDSAGVVYAYVGGGGHFSVPFARVGSGRGDYEPYAVANGIAYRYVGAGRGTHEVGRALPLPESHQLWSAGGGVSLGGFTADVEGAVSRLDRNTFSTLDDGDNTGGAGRARVALEAKQARGGWLERAGVAVDLRAVDHRFSPFGRLEAPFTEEDWGLPAGADLDRQRRVQVSAFARTGMAGELLGSIGHLAAPGGIDARRGTLQWVRTGALAARAGWERSASETGSSRIGGGRDRLAADARWALPWVSPAIRFTSDERRIPGDSAALGARSRVAGAELTSGSRLSWRATLGADLEHEARLDAGRFIDQGEVRVLRANLETPSTRAMSVVLGYQRRALQPLADPRRTRSDLGSMRLRGEDRARGLEGGIDLEVTAEAENRRTRDVVFVGAGQGGYDALGNFVGVGDYTLRVTVAPELERVSRAATSTRLAWERTRGPEAWRGSRAEFHFEAEVRRRGDLAWRDPMISPGAALDDPDLARAVVTQRLEAEIGPRTTAADFQLRGERRVTADRGFANFAQTLDDQSASLRWRARPGASITAEIEARTRRQTAGQRMSGTSGSQGFDRTLIEHGALGQVTLTPGSRLRLAVAGELSWLRPEHRDVATRTLRVGPDLGLAVGARGHMELSARRAFASGPAAESLLPTADPIGAPVWETNGRFDLRLHETTTFGVSLNTVDREARRTQVTGRAELRAFF